MKKTATGNGDGQKSNLDLSLATASQPILDKDCDLFGICTTVNNGDLSQNSVTEVSVCEVSESCDTKKEPLSLPAQQVRNGAWFNEEHRYKLKQSALTTEHISGLNWLSLPDGRLEIPYLNPDGTEQECHNGKPFKRWRSSQKAIDDAKAKGKKIPKYFSPKGNGCRFYHSPVAIALGNYEQRLVDTYTSLRITEGELKTEAATAHDPNRLTIGIGGVNSWRDRYEGGEESKPLIEFDEITLKDREVRICFDSDLQKPQVAAALRKLTEFLSDKGANVLIEILPNGLDGQRLGLDDLIYRHGPEFFNAIAGIARFPFKKYRKDGKSVYEYNFTPEPLDTKERNVYLTGMIGENWRRSDDAKDHWQKWSSQRWETIPGNDAINVEIEKFADLQEWKDRELLTINSLSAALRRSIQPEAKNNNCSGLVPFANGCLVLKNMELVPHNLNHGNTWFLPYDYNKETTCPKIKAFLLDRLNDETSVQIIRAFCNHLILSKLMKCFLEITGPSNTGKTIISNLIQALVGSENHAAGTLQRLEDRSQKFETMRYRNKRLAVFSECQDYVGQLQVLKSITGGDSIPGEIKNGRHLEFTFTGGVVLVGNGAIRASDPSGAVINRRRSLVVPNVVAATDERCLLDTDGAGGWRGELVEELAGFVNWCLDMPEAEAKAALSRDNNSIARAEIKIENLIASDLLIEWCEERLIWAPSNADGLRVGLADGEANNYLFPCYLNFIRAQGNNVSPLSLNTFKSKLVGLLRDTLGLPLPSGTYRNRNGSYVPCIGWRNGSTETPGIIRFAVMNPLRVCDGLETGKSFAGEDCDGCDDLEKLTRKEKKDGEFFSNRSEYEKPVTVITVNARNGLGHHQPVTYPSQGTPIQVQSPKTGEWESGWYQITRKGSTYLCEDPKGDSYQIDKKRVR